MGGVCDDQQLLCFAWSFWNGHDPILKERLFGLTGTEGNHGEDAKEYWWYLDSTPTHSWMRWRYFYPQSAFPYADLVDENRRRGKLDGEYELLDTGVFEQGYWDITVDYAKATPDDIVMRVSVRNAGAETATLDLLANLWFRNTWSWGLDDRRPRLTAKDGAIVAEHHALGRRVLAGPESPELLFCDNESNAMRLWGGAGSPLPEGRHRRSHRARHRHRQSRRRRHQSGDALPARRRAGAINTAHRSPERRWPGCGRRCRRGARRAREREADAFYATLTPAGATAEEASVMRQAFAGMLWSKQFFHYDVARWLDGDPRPPPPPATRPPGATRLAPPRQRTTSSRCRTRGSTPGTRRGTWRSTASRSPTSTRVRQGAAPAAVPRVVHAPQRPAARLRVDVRRREPAGARVGGAAGVRDRRLARLRVPRADLPEAAAQLHVVGEPQGRRGEQRVRGGLPRPRQHRSHRSIGVARRWDPRAVRRHAPGWACTA